MKDLNFANIMKTHERDVYECKGVLIIQFKKRDLKIDFTRYKICDNIFDEDLTNSLEIIKPKNITNYDWKIIYESVWDYLMETVK